MLNKKIAEIIVKDFMRRHHIRYDIKSSIETVESNFMYFTFTINTKSFRTIQLRWNIIDGVEIEYNEIKDKGMNKTILLERL